MVFTASSSDAGTYDHGKNANLIITIRGGIGDCQNDVITRFIFDGPRKKS